MKMWLPAIFFLMLPGFLLAQHRGDNLRFQGLDLVNRNGVRAMAMGGAFTAAKGELDALFWNPAGLVGLKGLQVSANYSSSNALWRESQDYRPNRQVVTMSFILDGLYMPNPEYNGWIDSDAFLEDSTYVVREPELGNDSYSEEAADWQRELDDSGIDNIVAALPLTVSGRPLVLAAGYSRRINVMNYDRNQTHLSPHPAYDGYGDLPPRVTSPNDSVRITWSDFQRQRSGPLKTFSFAAAYGVSEKVQVGFRLTTLSGKTNEFQTLNRIGHFDLVQGIQIFKFRYDTLDINLTGTSDFSATNLSLGGTFQLGKLSLGVNLMPGYTLKRKWNYQTSITSPDSSSVENTSGEDQLDIPFSYSFGLNIQPHDNFRIAFDMEHRPYAKMDIEKGDTGGFEVINPTTDPSYEPIIVSGSQFRREWVDQTSFRVGVEYKPVNGLALMAGYRNIPQVFIPDGAADHERGPEQQVYSFGASITYMVARLDAAYDISTLRYYDAYFSNTNFAYESTNHFRLGVTIVY